MGEKAILCYILAAVDAVSQGEETTRRRSLQQSAQNLVGVWMDTD